MLKKTVTYKDFNGIERTEDFYFNMTKAECVDLSFSKEGGLDQFLSKVIKANNTPEIMKLFKDFVLMAYGEKSDDGRRFMKTPEIKQAFSETEAYSVIFMELVQDANAAAEFVNNVIPAELLEQAQTAAKENK